MWWFRGQLLPPRYSRTTSTTPARPPSAAYPKGSPARTVVKNSSQSPTFMGFSRATTSTSVNGVVTNQTSRTTSSGGGGGFLGLALIASGAFFLWVVFRGKSGAMWNAITGDNSFEADLNKIASAIPLKSSGGRSGGSGGGGSKQGSGNQADSGTHMGIDPGGNIITINSSYGSMSDSEK